jgi:hypothetical protein
LEEGGVKFQSHWRKQAAEVISEVLDQCSGWETDGSEGHKAMRARLREAYPFGEKKYYPYKIWLDEIARQTGRKWPIGHKLAWMNSQKRFKGDRVKLAEWERLYGKQAS